MLKNIHFNEINLPVDLEKDPLLTLSHLSTGNWFIFLTDFPTNCFLISSFMEFF